MCRLLRTFVTGRPIISINLTIKFTLYHKATNHAVNSSKVLFYNYVDIIVYFFILDKIVIDK